jgi:hypothetical protein
LMSSRGQPPLKQEIVPASSEASISGNMCEEQRVEQYFTLAFSEHNL